MIKNAIIMIFINPNNQELTEQYENSNALQRHQKSDYGKYYFYR